MTLQRTVRLTMALLLVSGLACAESDRPSATSIGPARPTGTPFNRGADFESVPGKTAIEAMKDRTGASGSSCGVIDFTDFPTPLKDRDERKREMRRCLVRAYESKGSAYGWLWQQGIDSTVGEGMALTEGRVFLYTYDAAAACGRDCRGAVQEVECADPALSKIDDDQRVTCPAFDQTFGSGMWSDG